MLSKFSWQDYWLFMAAMTSIYYIAVIGMYYRSEISRLLFGRKPSSFSGKRTEPSFNPNPHPGYTEPSVEELPEEAGEDTEENISEEAFEEEDTYDEESLQLIEKVSDSISFVVSHYGESANKEELIMQTGHTISSITEPERLRSFRESLDWHIRQQFLLICGIELSDREIERIWEIAKD